MSRRPTKPKALAHSEGAASWLPWAPALLLAVAALWMAATLA